MWKRMQKTSFHSQLDIQPNVGPRANPCDNDEDSLRPHQGTTKKLIHPPPNRGTHTSFFLTDQQSGPPLHPKVLAGPGLRAPGKLLPSPGTQAPYPA